MTPKEEQKHTDENFAPDEPLPEMDRTQQRVAGDLLPCPFCGGEAKVYPCTRGLEPGEAIVFTGEDSDWTVGCIECNSHGATSFNKKEQAITAWNTRNADCPSDLRPVEKNKVTLGLYEAALALHNEAENQGYGAYLVHTRHIDALSHELAKIKSLPADARKADCHEELVAIINYAKEALLINSAYQFTKGRKYDGESLAECAAKVGTSLNDILARATNHQESGE